MSTTQCTEAQANCAPMTGNGISLFQNSELNCSIEVIEKEGDPWFLAKSVCDALEIGNSRQAVSYLDSDERGVITNDTLGGSQQVSIINESGLYSLILRSRKTEAKRFKKWVTAEVLPSIRKHGAYATAPKLEEMLANPETMILTLQALKSEQEKRKSLEVKVAEDKPKVLFADAVADSESTCLLGEFAKVLKQNGVNIGQNRLFVWMRENGYLVKQGEMRNTPTQRAMELGLFRVKKGAYINSSGVNVVTRTVKITGKGQQYFVSKFLGSKEVA